MVIEAILALAERQHGLVSIHQLRDLGLDRNQILRGRRAPAWEPVGPVVLRRRGAPRNVQQRVLAAVLDVGPGALLSHESAAAWWGHRGSRLERPIHVTTTEWSRRRPTTAKVHRVRRVDKRWVTYFDGVPVARPELVALTLFATMTFGRAERIVDSMWANRLLSGRSIGLLLGDLGRRGRNGTAGLRRFHTERGDEYVPPESGLESRVCQILSEAGIPVRRQVDLGDDTRWSGRVDFVLDVFPVVVEVQSELHHSSLTDVAADEARMARLDADGFEVAQVIDTQVWTDPGRVVHLVREGLRRAARRAEAA